MTSFVDNPLMKSHIFGQDIESNFRNLNSTPTIEIDRVRDTVIL